MGEGIRRFQEEVCDQRAEEVVRCMQEGTQGARNQRLLPCWRQNRARKGSLCQGEVAPRLIFGKQAGVLPSDMLAKFFLLRLLCASGRCTKGLRAIAAGIQRRGSCSCRTQQDSERKVKKKKKKKKKVPCVAPTA